MSLWKPSVRSRKIETTNLIGETTESFLRVNERKSQMFQGKTRRKTAGVTAGAAATGKDQTSAVPSLAGKEPQKSRIRNSKNTYDDTTEDKKMASWSCPGPRKGGTPDSGHEGRAQFGEDKRHVSRERSRVPRAPA